MSGHRLCQNGYHYDIDLALSYASSEVGGRTFTIERSGTGIDFDAFLAACPDLSHTPEGEKIVQAYMDDCSQSN